MKSPHARSGLFLSILLAALTIRAQQPAPESEVKAAAEESTGPEASFEVSLLTHYVWRGQVINDRQVVQPALTMSSARGIYIGVWGNIDLTDRNRSVEEDEDGNVIDTFNPENECSEVDSFVGYEYAPDDARFGVDVNVTHYAFSEPSGETDEVAAKAWLNIPLFEEAITLNPFVSVAYDFNDADGFYCSAGVEAEDIALDNAERLLLDLSVSAGYGDSDYNAWYFETDQSAWNDLTAAAALKVACRDWLTVKGTLSWSSLLDSDIADAAEEIYWDDQALAAGIGAEITF